MSNDIRRLESDLRDALKRIASIEKQIGKLPLRVAHTSGGGGSFTIETFEEFPEIPTEPTIISCKQQLWYAEVGYTVWKPTASFTTASGTPGT